MLRDLIIADLPIEHKRGTARMREKNMIFKTIILASVLLSGCIKFGSGGSTGGDSSFLEARVDGINAADEGLENLKYALVCNEKSANKYRIDGTSASEALQDGKTKSVVKFPDAKISLGDQCAMEITSEQKGPKDNKSIRFTFPETRPGLFYSSSRSEVKLLRKNSGELIKSLELTLYKVFGNSYTDPFTANVDINFQLEEGVVLPEDKRLSANLGECSNKRRELTRNVVTKSANQKTLSFTLSAGLMPGAICKEVIVAIDHVPAYRASVEIAFDAAQVKQGATLNFGPFTAMTVEEVIGTAQCTDLQQAGCQEVKMPRAANYWAALVSTANGDMVALSANGIILDPRQSLKVSDLNAKTGFSFYNANIDTDIAAAEFNLTDLNAALATKVVTEVPEIQNIKMVYLHGFATVSKIALDSKPSAHWAVKVTAKSQDITNEFLVTGAEANYFSSQKPAGGTMYFDWKTFVQNRGPASQSYRMYAFVNSAIQPAACDFAVSSRAPLTLNEALNEISELEAGNIATARPDLDDCRIVDGQVSYYDSWERTYRFLSWQWHKYSF